MNTKDLATSLAEIHETRDPLRIAQELGYLIAWVPLDNIRGFYQYTKRNHIIYLNEKLSENKARFVCGHELGHSLFHRGSNRIFMDTRTFMVTSKFEREADRFAVDLLYDDYDLRDFLECPISVVADCLGVSTSLAEYRMSSVFNK